MKFIPIFKRDAESRFLQLQPLHYHKDKLAKPRILAKYLS